jgi:peptidoglycan/LPS O-acetylase OafA/YrhL
MTDLPVSDDLLRRSHGGSWLRRLRAALPGLLYAGLVLAVFGGIAVDHLPESPVARLCMVGGGAIALVLAALWLDRREIKDAAEGAGD